MTFVIFCNQAVAKGIKDHITIPHKLTSIAVNIYHDYIIK